MNDDNGFQRIKSLFSFSLVRDSYLFVYGEFIRIYLNQQVDPFFVYRKANFIDIF